MALFGSSKFRTVKVSGSSMEPTYLHGDILLTRWSDGAGADLPLLSVVVIERDEMPGIFFIKRIQKIHGNGYWVEGDNRDPDVEARVNDSRSWGYIGAHEIRARVITRLWRTKRR